MIRRRKILFSVFLLLLAVVGCSTTRLPSVSSFQDSPNYTIIYLIHGDANYLYHNRKGKPLQADQKVLSEAKWVGKHAEKGEVFIFHLKPETQILYLFPRKDRHFLYYRNGELIYEKNYSPHSKQKVFATETRLYNHFHKTHTADSSYKNILLYFGHEVPLKNGSHYFRSRPNAQFSLSLFASGVSRFLQPKGSKFNLTVLSTCDNGTPLMVNALAPMTDYLLASPLNLHLSHIDTKTLELLDKPGEMSTRKLASSMASATYERLSSFLQTVISLTLYDISALKDELPMMVARYKAYLSQQQGFVLSAENVSCSNLSFFKQIEKKEGIKIWYKPPQFGVKTNKESFSGWGCRE